MKLCELPARLFPVFRIDARGGQQASVCSPSSRAGRGGSSGELMEEWLLENTGAKIFKSYNQRKKKERRLDKSCKTPITHKHEPVSGPLCHKNRFFNERVFDHINPRRDVWVCSAAVICSSCSLSPGNSCSFMSPHTSICICKKHTSYLPLCVCVRDSFWARLRLRRKNTLNIMKW